MRFYIVLTGLLCCLGSSTYAQKIIKSIPLQMEKIETWEEPFYEDEYGFYDAYSYDYKTYHGSAKRVNDILHVDLHLSFDFDKAYIYGKESLLVRPFNQPVDSLILDAKGMQINSVRSTSGKNLAFLYDGYKLRIALGRTYTREEEYRLIIEYVARPNELSLHAPLLNPYERGAYFVRPGVYFPEKPLQVWTQGETEDNSLWFPLIDSPNERFTHTISLRVPDSLQTLSNGTRVSSLKNADKTRTDIWKMSQDNAAYLVMFAIGKYALVKDAQKGISMQYYVEPSFAPYALDIFAHTREMMSFFSKKLGVPYPYKEYNQIVVRDYVSGAMENTGAVVFGEFVQRPAADLRFASNEGIVAHEMFHHWFGNLVTCESWANLPLNEAFANYSEYLWFEHKYGRFYADEKAWEEADSYFSEAEDKMVDLIRFNYKDRREMFDSHSYAKGGRILHMLRYYLGDDTFFRGLQHYLTQNANKPVEVHHLRLAFEEVSGEDLNWFFNQWFLDAGHPVLECRHSVNRRDSVFQAELELSQLATLRNQQYYRLPIDVDFYFEDGSVQREHILLYSADSVYTFNFRKKPVNINLDAEKILLAEIEEDKPMSYWENQWKNAPLFADKMIALRYLQNHSDVHAFLLEALKSPSDKIKSTALYFFGSLVEDTEDAQVFYPHFQQMLYDENVHPEVRQFVLQILMRYWNENEKLENTVKLCRTAQPKVASMALRYLFEVNYRVALEISAEWENKMHNDYIRVLAELYHQHNVPDKFDFYKRYAGRSVDLIDEYIALLYYGYYVQDFAKWEELEYAGGFFEEVLKNECSNYVRLGAYNGLVGVAEGMRYIGKADEADELDRMRSSYMDTEKDSFIREYLGIE